MLDALDDEQGTAMRRTASRRSGAYVAGDSLKGHGKVAGQLSEGQESFSGGGTHRKSSKVTAGHWTNRWTYKNELIPHSKRVLGDQTHCLVSGSGVTPRWLTSST